MTVSRDPDQLIRAYLEDRGLSCLVAATRPSAISLTEHDDRRPPWRDTRMSNLTVGRRVAAIDEA